MAKPGAKFTPKVIEDKCKKAGVSFWLASEVALAMQGEITQLLTEENLNDLIHIELRRRDSEAARKFENYHRVYVRTSDGLLDSFNKEKIVTSLLRETKVNQNMCKELASEVEEDIRRLELRYISAPLIREMVNSKLLEQRNMKAKSDYTRLGLPIYDVGMIIQGAKNISPPNPEAIHKHFGDAIAEEYALVKLLPEEVSRAHLEGEIHIHDLPYFATRPVSLQNDLRCFLTRGLLTDGIGKATSIAGPAKHPGVAISHALRVLLSGETHLSGGQSIDFFNTFLAPYTINCSEKELSQIIQTFLYELNQIYATRGGQLAESTLNFELETPDFLKKEKAVLPKGVTGQDTYADYEREAIRFLNIFLETMSKGDYKSKAFNTPKIILKIREKPVPFTTESVIETFLENNSITIVNMRNKRLGQNANIISPNELLTGKNKKWYTTIRTGVLQSVSINLPGIAMTAKDDAEFFGRLDTALKHAREVCENKRRIVESCLHTDSILPFLTQEFSNEEYYSLDNAQCIVSIVGFDNAVKEYTGSEITNSDAFAFGDKVLAYINSKLDNFNQQGLFMAFGCLDSNRVRQRFAKMNAKRFGIKEIYPSRGFTHQATQPIGSWFETEAKLQEHCFGATHLNVIVDNPMKTIYNLVDRQNIVSFTVKKRKQV